MTKRLSVYVWSVYLIAIGLLVLSLTRRYELPWQQLVFFGLLALLAGQSEVQLVNGTVSVSFPVEFAALILFGPAVAVVVSLFAAFTWLDITKRTSWFKVLFNFAEGIISIAASGFLYLALGGKILNQLHRAFEASDFPLIVLPLTLSIIIYFFLNTWLVDVAIGLEKNHSPIRVWLESDLWAIPNYVSLGTLGIVMAQIYVIAGPAGIILLIAPLLVARQVFQRYTKLRQIYSSSVMSLVKAVEVKDPYTRGHSERVAQYAEMIARELGLQESRIEKLKFAGYLHDVGKIGIPKKILNKPGRLTEEEYQRVKGHSELGTSILREIDFLKDIMPAILYHHEHLDAKGYPEGLVKESIPLEARIMAVADSYDAMTSARAYRPPMAKETAIDELKRCSGTQFDSQVVEAFVKVLQEQKEKVLKDQAKELKVQEKVAENNNAAKKNNYLGIFRDEKNS